MTFWLVDEVVHRGQHCALHGDVELDCATALSLQDLSLYVRLIAEENGVTCKRVNNLVILYIRGLCTDIFALFSANFVLTEPKFI